MTCSLPELHTVRVSQTPASVGAGTFQQPAASQPPVTLSAPRLTRITEVKITFKIFLL